MIRRKSIQIPFLLRTRIKSIHRLQHTSTAVNPRTVPRVTDNCDVLIVGAGPSGLAAAIRLKQLERESKSRELRVVVLEKGTEVGSHILSGCVLEPRALYDLLGADPGLYASQYGCGEPPLGQVAGKSEMLWLTGDSKRMIPGRNAIKIPHPPQMNNEGNYIISLSAFTRWLARVAEEYYGVEVYPGFAGAGVVFSDNEEEKKSPWAGWKGRWGKEVTGIKVNDDVHKNIHTNVPAVLGVVTNSVGISKSFTPKPSFEPGMFFRAKTTLLAEGAHGSLSKMIIGKYGLRRESEPQTYGFGVKEVWRVDEDNAHYNPGKITHTLGFPLDLDTYGGGWIYHMDKGLVSIGLVIGADWENPHKSPYKDFQMMKHHPYIRQLLSSSSTRIAYGARILTEGGLQSLPLLHFPGGALIGDTAGTVNVAKIKGVHTGMGMGMLGAKSAFDAVISDNVDLSTYSSSFLTSWIHSELHETRNLRPSFSFPTFTKYHLGILGGVLYSGIDSLLLKGRTPWTFRHTKNEEERIKCMDGSPSLDSVRTKSTSTTSPIPYPPFQPPLSTDLLTSVMLTGTSHEEDQPEHLRVLKMGESEEEGGLEYRLSEIREEEEEKSVEEQTHDGKYRDIKPIQPKIRTEPERRHHHVHINVGSYAGLLAHACPAGVYEYVDDDLSKDGNTQGEGWNGKKFVINAQNCIHCKLCDVKVPTQDITWTVPEGGGGPKYSMFLFFCFESLFFLFSSSSPSLSLPFYSLLFIPSLTNPLTKPNPFAQP
ncbi:hypothetical protein J3R30DRAFT_3421350 [Lentinula aciculospora]|uniref:electron-transferring-flavoprotein dehydrogenase n=1 Tax=Lentinula aciculospora TaxID=153920 RepID=A0A9W9ATU6_9AGAR|nr:hypothetical protein J3R30DRAFT_3421350 [Lentinula aciculospora]